MAAPFSDGGPTTYTKISNYLIGELEDDALNNILNCLSEPPTSYGKKLIQDCKQTVVGILKLMSKKGHISKDQSNYSQLIQCLRKVELREAADKVVAIVSESKGSTSSLLGREQYVAMVQNDHGTSCESGASELASPNEYITTRNGTKGLVCIINNFAGEREGAEKDAEDVRKLFLSEPFRKYYDLEPTQSDLIKKKLMSYFDSLVKKLEDPKYCSFFLFIMSHGNQEGLRVPSTNSEIDVVRWEKLAEPFNMSLPGKPKVLVIQACRGEDVAHDGIGQTETFVESDNAQPENIRTLINSDTLIAYPTFQGYLAFRSPCKGAWYIQELVKQLKKQHALTTRSHLTDILTDVNYLVSQKSAPQKRKSTSSDDNNNNKEPMLVGQMPQYVSTLRRRFYVLPRENPGLNL